MTCPDPVTRTSDVWLKADGAYRRLPPKTVRVLCAYRLYVGIDTIDEALFFRKTAESDELWISDGVSLHYGHELGRGRTIDSQEIIAQSDLKCGLAIRARIAGDQATSAESLLQPLISWRVGHAWLSLFLAAGAIDRTCFSGLLTELEQVVACRSMALTGEPRDPDGIHAVAHEFRYTVYVSTQNPLHGEMNCPNTKHSLFVSLKTNTFGCGYCRKKGGPKELREFIIERKRQAEEQRVKYEAFRREQLARHRGAGGTC